MNYTKELLLLHLTHAKQALERAKNNSYSDQRKETYQKSLFELFDAVEKDITRDLAMLSDQQIYDGYKKYLDFIIVSLQFLDSSTFNQIPYEIVECLKHAMSDWESTENFIIVTSLINDAGGFSYEDWLATDDAIYDAIKVKYPKLQFNQKLVQINLPRALARDYLIAVVLYHELGHFIDARNKICEKLLYNVLDKIYQKTYSAKELAELKTYLFGLSEYIDDEERPDWKPMQVGFDSVASHLMEYFSDIFAAQYVGNMCNIYVTYLCEEKDELSTDHPSIINRTKVVSDFISHKPNLIVTLISDSVEKIIKQPLEQRYSNVSDAAFFNLVPTDLKTSADLHGILNTGWNIWLNYQNVLASNLKSDDPSRIYSVINNLIEKSIGNYISISEWNKVVPETKVLANDELSKPHDTHVERFILAKKDVTKLVREKKLFISPLLDESQISEVGIDFRLGYDFLVSVQGRDAFINASKNEWVQGGQRRNIKQFFQASRRQLGETFILHPNQTVLAVSLEYVRLPENYMLMLFMRSSYARLGLTISTIAQPGYCGCLSLEFTNTNNNPINLAVGARIIQGILCPLSGPTQYLHTPRKYVCHVRPEPSAVISDKDLLILNELWKMNNDRLKSF